MIWLLLLTLAGNTMPYAGPFETREMCEKHKIEVLLKVSLVEYYNYQHGLQCEPGITLEKTK